MRLRCFSKTYPYCALPAAVSADLASPPLSFALDLTLGILLAAVVAWAQNELEDRTGKVILEPDDRLIGDARLGTGLGARVIKTG
jgi:hypothetical protein